MSTKKSWFRFLLFPLVALFGLLTLFTDRGQIKAAEHGDVITRMYFTDINGNPLAGEVSQWQQFRLNADFTLPDNLVQKDDTLTVTLPPELHYTGAVNFSINAPSGEVVATAVAQDDTGQIQLTFTDYVEKHSGVSGTFFFYIRVDHNHWTTRMDEPIDITVGGRVIPAGNLQFQGIGTPRETDISKSGWQDDVDSTLGHYYIAVNRSSKNMTGVRVIDVNKTPGVQYIQDSFRIEKGVWVFRNGDWELDNMTDITNQTNVIHEESKFTVELGDLTDEEGVKISYDVRLPYAPTDKNDFANDVSLSTTNGIDVPVQSGYQFLLAGGHAQGHVYGIQIQKTDEAGQPMADVVFDVIRNRNQVKVGQITTNADGQGSLIGLLNDEYTIKEVSTPAGYLPADDVVVNPADFDPATRIATKTIINKKKPYTPVKVSLKATKELTGRALAAGEFEFKLYDKATGAEVASATNDATGLITFGELTFDKVGQYTYVVKEVQGSLAGVVYDLVEYDVIVTVTDDGTGQLVATVDKDEQVVRFTNSYETTSTTTTTTSEETTTTTTTTEGETTTTTTTSEETTTTTTPGEEPSTSTTTTPGTPPSTTTVTPGPGLPKTGESTSFLTTILGFILLVAGVGAILFYRKAN